MKKLHSIPYIMFGIYLMNGASLGWLNKPLISADAQFLAGALLTLFGAAILEFTNEY